MVMDTLFGWLLNLPDLLAIFILALFVSIFMTLIYKLTTNQNLMKDLKEELKAIQEQMKKLKNNPEKMMTVNARAMEINSKYMMHSMKPMIFTMIPVVVIFSWLMATYAFVGIDANTDISLEVNFAKDAIGNVSVYSDDLELITPNTLPVSGTVLFTFKGKEVGNYSVDVLYADENYTLDVVVGTVHAEGTTKIGPSRKVLGLIPVGPKAGNLAKDSDIKNLGLVLEDNKPFGGFSFFGWRPGALGTYILCSIICSMVIRKLFKVY